MSKAEQVAAKKQQGKIRKMNRGGSGRKLVWNCKLHEMRDNLNLTLRDIEAHTGVSSAVLSTIEYGTDPQLTTAVAIADFFGVSVVEMWPGPRGFCSSQCYHEHGRRLNSTPVNPIPSPTQEKISEASEGGKGEGK